MVFSLMLALPMAPFMHLSPTSFILVRTTPNPSPPSVSSLHAYSVAGAELPRVPGAQEPLLSRSIQVSFTVKSMNWYQESQRGGV